MTDVNGVKVDVVPGLPGATGTVIRKTADELRSSIFSAKNKKPKSITIDFFGEMIEIRQPTLRKMTEDMEMGGDEDDLPSERMVKNMLMMLQQAYVPGTDERVFSDTDREMLEGMPYGEDFDRLVNAYKKLTSIDVEVTEKNSKARQDSKGSKS